MARFHPASLPRPTNEFADVAIDDFTVAKCFGHGRTRDKAAQIAAMHVTGGVVIGIEKERVFGNGRDVAGDKFFQDERFEKPGSVREMPFRWAHIRHRLHDAIFRLEIAREQFEKSRTSR